MDDAPDREWAAFVGIDWSDEFHTVHLRESATATEESFAVEQTPEAIHAWIAQLRARFGARPIAVALEQTRGALVYLLMQYDFLVLYPVNPKSLARFREALTPSKAKNDPADARLLCEMVALHRSHLRPWKPDTEQTRELAALNGLRRSAAEDRAAVMNQLGALLKTYYPQALALFNDLAQPAACHFLTRWPSLPQAQSANPNTIRKLFYAHHCRRMDVMEQRLATLRGATALTTDPAIVRPAIIAVTMLARQILALNQAIGQFEERIAHLFSTHPDAPFFDCLPGAGKALAPRLLAAFGTDRDRWESAQAIQELCGAAPVTKQSGKSKVVHRRWACPTFLLQTFHEFAGHSIRFSAWARAFYEYKRQEGQGHHQAVRMLAFKWIRVLYRCWHDRTPYDESRYLQSLARRGSPLLKFLKTNPQVA